MSDNVFHSQPGYILHQHHYRETSLIIDVLTRDFGRLSLIAKGVRKAKSKTAGILRPFTALSLSYVGKTNLRTLTDVEPNGFPFELSGLAFYCGFYVNELICNFLHKDDPHPEVFQDYEDCLTGLAKGDSWETKLRLFELDLMENIGYGLQLSYDYRNDKPIQSDKKYLFNKDFGLVEDLAGQFSGKALLAIQKRQFNEVDVLNEAKTLMRIFIDCHLQGKQLKTRSVINSIIKRL